MKDILKRKDGVDLIVSGEYGDPFQDYSLELFDPDNEDGITHEIPCKGKKEAESLFNRICVNGMPIHS